MTTTDFGFIRRYLIALTFQLWRRYTNRRGGGAHRDRTLHWPKERRVFLSLPLRRWPTRPVRRSVARCWRQAISHWPCHSGVADIRGKLGPAKSVSSCSPVPAAAKVVSKMWVFLWACHKVIGFLQIKYRMPFPKETGLHWHGSLHCPKFCRKGLRRDFAFFSREDSACARGGLAEYYPALEIDTQGLNNTCPLNS